MSEFLCSVHMITYNHEKYIAEAINGVLNQRTNFPIELIISDDCSTDNTASIIADYASKYKEIIKPIIRNKNLGAIKNFIDTFSYCKGKYIAICEGDDYWIDPLKLQQQVDFMEMNMDIVICSTLVNKLINNQLIESPSSKQFKFYSHKDLLTSNYIYTASVLFRNPFDYPEYLSQSLYGDIMLWRYLTGNGSRLAVLPIITTVYRVHNQGVFSRASNREKINIIIKDKLLYFRHNCTIKIFFILFWGFWRNIGGIIKRSIVMKKKGELLFIKRYIVAQFKLITILLNYNKK